MVIEIQWCRTWLLEAELQLKTESIRQCWTVYKMTCLNEMNSLAEIWLDTCWRPYIWLYLLKTLNLREKSMNSVVWHHYHRDVTAWNLAFLMRASLAHLNAAVIQNKSVLLLWQLTKLLSYGLLRICHGHSVVVKPKPLAVQINEDEVVPAPYAPNVHKDTGERGMWIKSVTYDLNLQIAMMSASTQNHKLA